MSHTYRPRCCYFCCCCGFIPQRIGRIVDNMALNPEVRLEEGMCLCVLFLYVDKLIGVTNIYLTSDKRQR